MGYRSYFALQVADYGMTVDEMMKLLDDAIATTKPLYDGLHCFARYELAARFKRPPPTPHSGALAGKPLGVRPGPGWSRPPTSIPCSRARRPRTSSRAPRSSTCRSAFPSCPRSFWEKSDLYPVPPGLTRKKNTHASAWHIDLEQATSARS